MGATIVKKYILYGASFNPPHIGHFSAISQMLEEYDYVVVFPYPKKHANGVIEVLPPLKQRMEMLKIFIGEHFPQMAERVILTDLATEMGLKDKINEGIYHTYDYLQYVKSKIEKEDHLSVCLGFEAQNKLRAEVFYKENEIVENFGVFRLAEENTIKSDDLRQFFSNHKNLKNAKDELHIKYQVGNELAEHIFKHNYYGVKKKVLKSNEKKSTNTENNNEIVKKKNRP